MTPRRGGSRTKGHQRAGDTASSADARRSNPLPPPHVASRRMRDQAVAQARTRFPWRRLCAAAGAGTEAGRQKKSSNSHSRLENAGETFHVRRMPRFSPRAGCVEKRHGICRKRDGVFNPPPRVPRPGWPGRGRDGDAVGLGRVARTERRPAQGRGRAGRCAFKDRRRRLHTAPVPRTGGPAPHSRGSPDGAGLRRSRASIGP